MRARLAGRHVALFLCLCFFLFLFLILPSSLPPLITSPQHTRPPPPRRHRVVRWFWQCLEAMSREERVRMLQFTTGCSRLPAQGFKALQSNDGNYRRFNIQAISKKVV